MDLLILIVVSMAIFVPAAWYANEMQRKRRERWREAARQLQMTYTEDRIQGLYEGLEVAAYLEWRGGRRRRECVTVFRAFLTSSKMPRELDLRREEFLDRLFGIEEVQLNLPGIDEQMLVRGASAEELRRWASDPDVARGIADLVSLKKVSFQVKPDLLTLAVRSAVTDVEPHFVELARIASAFEAAHAGRGEEPGSAPEHTQPSAR